MRSESGAATVEHAAISLLIALLLAATVAALASGAGDGGRELGSTLARRLRCAAVGPGPCWRDALTLAYGRSVAGAVRALAPDPVARAAPGGAMVLPVDFRRCRSVSCAVAGDRPGVTAQGRRSTEFVSVAPAGGVDNFLNFSYWLYRPAVGWVRVARLASNEAITRLAPTPLPDDEVPVLVPLETLDGRNQYDFPAGEEPPWRWRVPSVIPPIGAG